MSAPATPGTAWANRITGAGTAAPDQLLANPRNPRRHSGTQQEAMKAVLERVGWVTDVIVNTTTGHVVDGHMRVELAMRAGIPEIPVKYVSLSEAEEAEVLATFDPLAGLAVMDRHALADLLGDVDPAGDERLDVLMQGLERRAAPPTDTDFLSEYLDGDRDETTPRSRVEPAPNEDPGDQGRYVPLTYSVTPEERRTVLNALALAREIEDLPNSNAALVAVCAAYVAAEG